MGLFLMLKHSQNLANPGGKVMFPEHATDSATRPEYGSTKPASAASAIRAETSQLIQQQMEILKQQTPQTVEESAEKRS